jgi:hypothetical protein
MVMWFCSSKAGGNSMKRLMLLTCSMSQESSLIILCVICRCPSNHKELFVKRLIALPGEWMQLPGSPEVTKIPEGQFHEKIDAANLFHVSRVESDNSLCDLQVP